MPLKKLLLLMQNPELILCMYIFRFCRKHIHFLQNRTKFLLYYCLCFLLYNLTVVLLFRFLSYYLSVLMNYNLFFNQVIFICHLSIKLSELQLPRCLLFCYMFPLRYHLLFPEHLMMQYKVL